MVSVSHPPMPESYAIRICTFVCNICIVVVIFTLLTFTSHRLFLNLPWSIISPFCVMLHVFFSNFAWHPFFVALLNESRLVSICDTSRTSRNVICLLYFPVWIVTSPKPYENNLFPLATVAFVSVLLVNL